jgi:tetratricopeptide (TPR) repeat protein
VWAQSVFTEQRRWGTADPAHVAQATAMLEDLKILPKGNPERLKAEIGLLLVNKQPDAALAVIRAAKLDGESPLLEAEALLQKGQAAEAVSLLDGPVKNAPTGAGWHALGLAHLELKKPERAQADFEAGAQGLPGAPLLRGGASPQLAWPGRTPPASSRRLEPAAGRSEGARAPGAARGLALKGAALLLQSKPADAVAGLEEAVRIDPNNVYAKGTLARTYAALKAGREGAAALEGGGGRRAGQPDLGRRPGPVARRAEEVRGGAGRGLEGPVPRSPRTSRPRWSSRGPRSCSTG